MTGVWEQLTAAAYTALADGNCTVSHRVGLTTRDGGRLDDVDGCADWSVTFDATSDVYAKGTATFTDPSLWAGELTDPLSPYGTELAIARGLHLFDDRGVFRTEWIPMGVFVVTDVDDDLPSVTSGGIAVTLEDRSTYFPDTPVAASSKANPAERIVDAITRWVRECPPLAGATVVDLTGSSALCPPVDLDTSRASTIRKFAASIGAETYFDRLGRFVIRPIPLADTAPIAWEISDGEGGSLITLKRTVTRRETYSRVTCVQIVKESSDTAPVAATATSTDLDPTSPTYHPTFGRSHTFRSPLWTTTALCQANADRLRALSREAGRTITATHLPMEALDRGDAVRLRVTSAETGRTERLVQMVQSFTVGARPSAGPQTLGARGIQLPADDDDSLAAAVATAAMNASSA